MSGRTVHNLMATRWTIQALRKIREAKGWIQQDLAARMGIGQATVAAMEKRRYDPQMSTIIRWLEGLEVEADLVIRSVDLDDSWTIPLTGNGAKEIER